MGVFVDEPGVRSDDFCLVFLCVLCVLRVKAFNGLLAVWTAGWPASQVQGSKHGHRGHGGHRGKFMQKKLHQPLEDERAIPIPIRLVAPAG